MLRTHIPIIIIAVIIIFVSFCKKYTPDLDNIILLLDVEFLPDIMSGNQPYFATTESSCCKFDSGPINCLLIRHRLKQKRKKEKTTKTKNKKSRQV